ncbi:hypothetical protein C2G38_2139631 [Gigaspora rosea]|uniref:Uncharacterized protein n=1 Tax=Gigaspora rosea TaxID=44941 RepID=A0A397VNY8_9GLOM|nr:hypothetical protein C2G38_2139631 [Gigaspora rosea]
MGLTLGLAEFYRFLFILQNGIAYNPFFVYKLIHESGHDNAKTAYNNEPEDVRNVYKYLAEIFKIGSQNIDAAHKMVRESFMLHLTKGYIEQNISKPQNEIADITFEERLQLLSYALGRQTSAETYNSLTFENLGLGVEQNLSNPQNEMTTPNFETTIEDRIHYAPGGQPAAEIYHIMSFASDNQSLVVHHNHQPVSEPILGARYVQDGVHPNHPPVFGPRLGYQHVHQPESEQRLEYQYRFVDNNGYHQDSQNP